MQLPIISKIIKPSKLKTILTVHLGDGIVIAAVCSYSQTQENDIKILGVGKQKQGESSKRGKKILDLDNILETTDLAIQRAYLSAGAKPQNAIFGLSSGAILGKGFTVRLNRPQAEQPISQKELTTIFKKIQEGTSKQAQDYILSSNPQFLNPEPLGFSITQYKIDGKKVNTPLGLSGKILETCILHTFVEEEDMRTLDIIASELELKLETFYETVLNVAGELLLEKESGILLLIESNTTEIVPFKNGKIFGNKIFNLEEKSEFWLEGLIISLLEFHEVKPLPSQFFLLGTKDLAGSLSLKLETLFQRQVLPLYEKPNVEFLDEEIILKSLCGNPPS